MMKLLTITAALVAAALFGVMQSGSWPSQHLDEEVARGECVENCG